MDTEFEPAKPIAWYEIIEAGSSEKKWMLLLYPDYFRLERADGELHEVDRVELPERVQMFDNPPFLRRTLLAKLGKKSVFFKLSPEVFASFTAWIGPPTREDLRVSLRRRFSWVLPIGILLVLTSLPLGELSWDPLSFGMGLALIVTATLTKRWPHRSLFALDSLWFAFSAAYLTWLLVEEWSWLRLMLIVLQLGLINSGLRDYFRLAPERMATESETESDPDEISGLH